MGRYQLGRELEPKKVEPLEAFIRALSGETPDMAPYRNWVAGRLARAEAR